MGTSFRATLLLLLLLLLPRPMRLYFRSGLCDCVQNISKGYEWIFTKFSEGMGRGTRNSQLDSGGDPDPFLPYIFPKFSPP